jgi:hypothetical protein
MQARLFSLEIEPGSSDGLGAWTTVHHANAKMHRGLLSADGGQDRRALGGPTASAKLVWSRIYGQAGREGACPSHDARAG